VLTMFRHQGIGTEVVRRVEIIAKEEHYKKVTLTPSPLEPGYPEERLTRWYEKQGYNVCTDCETELEKYVS
jgi:histone acetyltransferase (RNA polymerase elongator complex component)